jgi:hypothetical protein
LEFFFPFFLLAFFFKNLKKHALFFWEPLNQDFIMDMQLEIVTQFVRPPLICDEIFCIVEGVAVWP